MEQSSKPLLLIRADADTRIGAGHVMRALAVAQAWQDRGGAARMLFAQPNFAMASRLSGDGVEVEVLGCVRASAADATEVVERIGRESPAGVLVDGYEFGADYLWQLQAAGRPIMLFDDYVQAPRLPVQAIVNQNLYAQASDYARAAIGNRLLMGPHYLALRREYRHSFTPRASRNGHVRRIVVTLGGGDADNVTSLVLEALAQVDMAGFEVIVLAGSQNPNLSELEQRVRSLGAHASLEVDRRDMPSLLATCELAVCGAGATCWEMAYMGVVTLPIALAPNQLRIAAAVEEHSIGRSLGWHQDLTVGAVARAVSDVSADAPGLAAMGSRARLLFDGYGAERVACEIAALATAKFVPAGEVA